MNHEQGQHGSLWLNEHKRVVLSNRDYQAVRFGSRIPDKYFKPDDCVLSVGEGLSDFVRRVRDEEHVQIVSADPIYSLGKDILTDNEDKIRARLEREYGDRVIYRPHARMDATSLPDPNQMVAASVYQLPFRDETFNKVVAYRVQEHIDLGLAVPEMTRVLTEHGEIRLGECLLMARPEILQLYPGRVFIKADGSAMFDRAVGFSEAMDYLNGHGEYQVYVQLTLLPRDNTVRDDLGLCVAGTLVIRNDEVLPQCEPFTDEERAWMDSKHIYEKPINEYPYLGNLYQLETAPNRDSDADVESYRMSYLNR